MRPLRCLLVLLIVLLPAGPFATTFPVTKTADTDDGVCDPDCSLREAIDAANTNPGADGVPVPAGTYLLTLGQLVVSDDVSIAGAGQATTIIDGNATDRVFNLRTSIMVEISDVRIQNGNAVSYGRGGGGIFNLSHTILTDTTVSENFGEFGGGISNGVGYNRDAAMTLINSTVSGNVAIIGGGIASGGTDSLTLTNSTVSGNTAGSFGGGIDHRSGAPLTLTNSTVSGNTADNEGGGINSSGTVIMNNSTVSGNTVYIDPDCLPGSCDASGGGINHSGNFSVPNPTITVTNSTISGNYAEREGGGISNSNGSTMTLTNSTVSGNSSNLSGGGIAEDRAAYRYLTNTIVNDNLPDNCSSNVDSLGYNLTDDTTCGFTESGDLVVADAMLYPLGNFGGPTKTHHPMTGSPAIDAANNADCPADDQRGESRPFDGDDPPDGSADCDIGSVEYLPEPHHAATLIVGTAFLGLLYRRCAGWRVAEPQEEHPR